MLLLNYRADVMLPGPLQCRQVYEKMLSDIVRASSYLCGLYSVSDVFSTCIFVV